MQIILVIAGNSKDRGVYSILVSDYLLIIKHWDGLRNIPAIRFECLPVSDQIGSIAIESKKMTQ